ncbi:FadR/GntR family transcriptional regulator [Paracoccus aestuariivivens]|uniref:FCD domain-containing protein n=1 Tax=Paracoccus aestuariivivens TaxID=1820333 RepID=A0A6L6JAW7_9RHOB|nr:FadR/GntR family transcriptional regulator [Paracoccus aestuariivivens]MTH79110.1 FCD domain-containing protein [Paracoccus aestuariivivens]
MAELIESGSFSGEARPLVAKVIQGLRADIEQGSVKPGDRIGSETDLAREHSVSRAVVREAIAVLRSEGVLNVRRGVGAFVLEPVTEQAPFAGLSRDRVTSVIELIELRLGFETEAASLAAMRRSAAQMEAIIAAHEQIGDALAEGTSTRFADYMFHLRIAEATQNRCFSDLMVLCKAGMVSTGPDRSTIATQAALVPNENLQQEHGRIVNAILRGDAEDARKSMRAHLEGSRERYGNILLSRVTG